MNAAPASHRHPTTAPRDARVADGAEARRRTALLAIALIVPMLAVIGGAPGAWPLFALPLALALPLGGPRALALGATLAGLAMALASGAPGTDGRVMAVGLGSFVLTGGAVGLAHRAQERQSERIAVQSLMDRLTGVHNYASFADTLPRECRRAERYGVSLSLILLDLDHFKAFNDQHGHDAGNRLLTAVGAAIRTSARATDFAARFGGEEFALIIPGPAEEAIEAAERIRESVARVRVPVAGGEMAGTTISAGVADFENGTGDTGDRLLEQADRALYRAKEHGRDRVSLYSPDARWARAS